MPRPHYRLTLGQRAVLGWKHKKLEDVNRIGGFGLGFTVAVDVLLVGIMAVAVKSVAEGVDQLSGGELVGVAFAVALCALFGLLLVRLNVCGVEISDGAVSVRNPWRQYTMSATEVERIGRGKLGIAQTLELRDGRSIALWGVLWQGGAPLSPYGAACKSELEWRLSQAGFHGELGPRTCRLGQRRDSADVSTEEAPR